MKVQWGPIAAVALAFGALPAWAQSSPASPAPTRAEVKKDTADANKAGAIPGTGTGPNANYVPPITAKSDTSRAEVKKETAAANKAGAIPNTGTGPTETAAEEKAQRAAKSTASRAEVKKETAAANKAGDIRSGEANLPAKDK